MQRGGRPTWREECAVFETGKQKVVAVGVGAVAGLTLLGGAAFAQTPGGTSTPTAQPSATAPAEDDSGGMHKDGKDCPHDQGGDSSGGSSGSNSSYRGA